MRFFGDKSVEFFLRNNTVEVQVSTLDHLLKSVVVSQLTQILGNLAEVLKGNESCIKRNIPVFWESKVMKTL